MLVPTRTPCCCLSVGYLAEKPLGENSWSSVIMSEHTWIPASPHVQISQKWALKLPSKSPLGNVLALKTALYHLLTSLHTGEFMHLPIMFLGMLHAWLSQFFLTEEVFLCVENVSCSTHSVEESCRKKLNICPPNSCISSPIFVFSSCFAVQSSHAASIPSSKESVVTGACCRWACHPLLLFGGLLWE